MRLALVTPPALEPLTAAEAERHLRFDETSREPKPPAPTVALASPAAPGNVDNGAHRYRVTFVTADGETEGGDISAAVTVTDKAVNGQVQLTTIPIGGSRVTSRKLYRTAAGGSTYLLLATIGNNTASTYTDNVADASLGAEVPSANTTESAEIRALIIAAREWVERNTGRALIEQEWRLKLDRFPLHSDEIELPRAPLISVGSVKYLDTNGVEQTLSPSAYVVDADSQTLGRIVKNYGESWPATRPQPGAVTITFLAGYGAAASAVPEMLKAAMKLVLADLHGNRSAGIVGTIHTVNPAALAIIDAYRTRLVG